MKVRIAPEALIDPKSIGDYIARDNYGRARSFVLELEARCWGLARHPQAYPVVEDLEDLGIRRRNHRRYAILYMISGDRIDVLRIVHGARDIAALFGK